jgi:hypothetical protein
MRLVTLLHDNVTVDDHTERLALQTEISYEHCFSADCVPLRTGYGIATGPEALYQFD